MLVGRPLEILVISEISEIYNALIDGLGLGGPYRRVGVGVQHEIRWRGLRLSY